MTKAILLKRLAAAEAKLRIAEQAVFTAVGAMESDATTFRILADCEWMQTIDPAGTGPKAVCATTSDHLLTLAAVIKSRLEH